MENYTTEDSPTLPRSLSRREAIKALPHHPLFSDKPFEGYLTYDQRVQLSVARAKAIVDAYALTVHDVATLTQPFWDMHTDRAMAMDTGAGTLVTIQINLAAGTLVKHLKQPTIKRLVDDILSFRVIAHYCLTEVAHGLDAVNIETTATALPDGGFDLHSPNPGASKIMPPTSPCGVPAVGVVFAKLVVKGQNFGIRPFVLPFNDGTNMMPGITAKLMPPREGAPPVYHSITSFTHVKLPSHALLGPLGSRSADLALIRANYQDTIWRTSVGGMALGASVLPAMERSAYIAGRYSQRRTVGVPNSSKRIPILFFRTQHAPILITLAQTFVAKAFLKVALANFTDTSVDLRVRQAWATIVKATLVDHSKTATLVLSSRCGAQGLFAHNEICSQHASILGLSIAEGDVLGLCIRLASELLQARYHVPKSTHPSSALARHEDGLFAENRAILNQVGGHRSADFNNLVLPKSEVIVRAIGHRMAYDAAIDANLDKTITGLYLASTVMLDSAWYAEHADFGSAKQDKALNEAVSAALPCLDDWLERTGAEAYSQVPILSDANWKHFTDGLREYKL